MSVSEKKWTELDAAQHRAHAMRLLDGLEVIGREKRLKVARAILYMAQGQSTGISCVFEAIVACHHKEFVPFSLQGRLQNAAVKRKCSTGIDTTSFCCSTSGPFLLWWNS